MAAKINRGRCWLALMDRVARTMLVCVLCCMFFYFSWSVILFGFGLFAQPGIWSGVQYGVMVGITFGILRTFRQFGWALSAVICICCAVLLHVVIFGITLVRMPEISIDMRMLMRLFGICLALDLTAGLCAGVACASLPSLPGQRRGEG